MKDPYYGLFILCFFAFVTTFFSFNQLLKISYLKKNTFTNFFLIDFNTNSSKYNINSPTNEILDSVSSHHILTHILQPTLTWPYRT